MKTGKKVLGAVLAAAMALSSITPVFAADKVKITFMSRDSGDTPIAKVYEDQIAAFMEENPDIEVQNDSVYEESAYNNKLKVALSTGETPNIFYYPAIAGLKEWAQNGVLLDLTDSLNEDEEWKNTFLDGALDTYDLSAYGVDGIYALPNELNVDAIFYNKALFEKAGIEKTPETMDELYEDIDKLVAAGITPFVEGSVMQPMQADSSVSGGGSPGFPTPPDYVTPGLGALQDFGSSLSTLGARLDSIKADTELKNAQAAKVQSETIAQNNVNSIFDLTKAITEFDFLSKKYKTAVDKLNAEWAPIEKMQDAAEKQAAIEELRSRYTKQLAEAAKTDADREINKVLSEKLGKVYDADVALKGEQAKTEGAKREDLGASADYRRVLSSVETAKLPAFLDEVKARISKINAERLTESQRALLTQYEADIKRALARHEEGEMREILRKIETTGESLWSLIVPKLFGN